MRLHFGNLADDTTAEQLMDLARPFGAVSSEIITDRISGASRGYGFVKFRSDAEGAAAVAALGGSDVGGLPIRVG